MPARLVVVGDLVEDVVVWADGPAQRGTDTAARVFRSRGGSAANVAVAAAPHVATVLVTCVGADPLGDRLLGVLPGVDVRAQRRGRTGTVVVLVDADGERTFLSDRGAAAELGPVEQDVLDGAGALHVPLYGLQDGSTAASVRALVAAAHARGVTVSVDTSSWAVLRALGGAELVRELRPSVVLANRDEAAVLGPLEGVELVVKDGPRPTRVHRADGTVRTVPVEPVHGVRDSTGAGDAFAAGWLAALLDGADEVQRVQRGHALARTVLASPGAGGAEEPQ